MGKSKDIRSLFDRYRKGTATKDERHTVAKWLKELDLSEIPFTEDRVQHYANRSSVELKQRLVKQSTLKPNPFRIWIPRVAAAIVIIGALSLWFVHYLPSPKVGAQKGSARWKTVEQSFLELSDGRNIGLDTLSEGAVIHDHGMSIRMENGVLYYVSERMTNDQSRTYHTIHTAKGKAYQLMLSDGTHLWLNASSRFTYPLQFSKTMRTATLSGEAYFEVSKAKNQPFVLTISGKPFSVQVLGTAFNVSAYDGHSEIQTTLVSGRVKLLMGKDNKKVLLKPSQKALYFIKDEQLQVSTVDAIQTTNWMGNRLAFKGTTMREALKRLGNTYDVDFRVKNQHIYQYELTGTFDGKSLNQVLDYMRFSSNIQYQIKYEQVDRERKTIVELN